MATAKSQRVGIWIIVIALTIGTLGSFVAIVLGMSNDKADQAALNQAVEKYQDEVEVQKNKDYEVFNKYTSRVSAFDAASVTELKTQDLETGEGEAITKESPFQAYYLGWNVDGKIFDGSIEGDGFKDDAAPYTVYPGAVIEGWTEGTVGMKPGGVRELTIPAEKAYGETGSGNLIAPNAPIKFIIMIPTDTPIPDILRNQ